MSDELGFGGVDGDVRDSIRTARRRASERGIGKWKQKAVEEQGDKRILTKTGAKPVFNGIVFDSETEVTIYKRMLARIRPEFIQTHESFLILEGFKVEGMKRKKAARHFTVDFMLGPARENPSAPLIDGDHFLVDVKGWLISQDWKLRCDMCICRYRHNVAIIKTLKQADEFISFYLRHHPDRAAGG